MTDEKGFDELTHLADGMPLYPQTEEGTAHFVQKLRDLIQRIEENPGTRIMSLNSLGVEVRPVPEKIRRRRRNAPLTYNTGKERWTIEAVVVHPVPLDDQIAGLDYA